VKRRVILTGTPIQNDLTEYFSLLNFANPNYLGTRLDFRKNFELAIIRGRDADASDADKAKCNEKLKELNALVMKLIIRRTNDLLSKYRTSKVFLSVADILIPLQCPLNTNKLFSAGFPTFSSHYIGSSSRHLRSKPFYAGKTHSR
jgi:DNA repair and recombination protein RAD54 and RAD54-like protein